MVERPEPESLFQRMKRRKLFQWALAYAGGAWLLLQLLSLLAQPFAWPDLVLRASVVVLGVGFIAVIVLAWFHGEKGQQKAGGIELLMLAALFIVAATGVTLVARRGVRSDSDKNAPPSAQAATAAPADQRSIAVLPFENMSADAENEYFSDGITEDVLTNLSKIGSLRVISRTSVMRYKGTDKLIPEIARELGVAHIVGGSVRRAGNRVRITAQLIRASSDEHLWAETYDRDLADIFAVQSEIARAIADALKARLSAVEGQRIAKRPTESIEAYDRYMRGRAEYERFSGTGRTASRLLREALELDPEFALAIAYLARIYATRSLIDPSAKDSALALANRAVAVAPDGPDGYSALAETYRMNGQHTQALEQYRRALELDPNHAPSIAEMGQTLGFDGLGRFDEALPWIERAIALDPGTAWYFLMLGDAHRKLGDYEAAANAFERGIRIDPNYVVNITERITLAVQVGDPATARKFAELFLQVNRSPSRISSVTLAYAEGGDAARAGEYARSLAGSSLAGFGAHARAPIQWIRGERALALRSAEELERDLKRRVAAGDRSSRLMLGLAYIAIIRGDEGKTLEHLEGYFANGGRDEALLTKHLMLAALQNEPRLRALVEQIRRDIAEQRRRLDAVRRRR